MSREISPEDYERLSANLKDFARVINDAFQHKADVTVLPEEAEAVIHQNLIYVERYQALTGAGVLHYNPHITHGIYTTVILRLKDGYEQGTNSVIKSEEIVDFSRSINYLTAINLLYEAYFGIAEEAE